MASGIVQKKAEALRKIAGEIGRCRICKTNKIGLPVPGEGNPDADVVFIGEAPGKQEAKAGRPFIGRAGKVLRGLIAKAGLKEEKVFITSPVKYLPKYVTPTLGDIKHGRKHLSAQFRVIEPKIVVLLGRVAALAVLEQNFLIARDHGKIVKKDGITYLITYHPAAPLYSPKVGVELERDFKKLKRLI